MTKYVGHAVRLVWAGVRALLRAAASVVKWWWDTFLTNPLAGLVVLLFLLTFGTLAASWVVRLVDPEHAIMVSPFELPAGPAASLGVTGRTIAHGLTDDLQTIAREAGKAASTGLDGSPGGGGPSNPTTDPLRPSGMGAP